MNADLYLSAAIRLIRFICVLLAIFETVSSPKLLQSYANL